MAVIKLVTVFDTFNASEIALNTILSKAPKSQNLDAANANLSNLFHIPSHPKFSFQIVVGLLFIEAGLHFLEDKKGCDVVGDFVHNNYLWKNLSTTNNILGAVEKKESTNSTSSVPSPAPSHNNLPEINSTLPIPYWVLQQHMQAREIMILQEQKKQLSIIDKLQRQIASLQNAISNNVAAQTNLEKLEQAIIQKDEVPISLITTYAPYLLQIPAHKTIAHNKNQNKPKPPGNLDPIIIDDEDP